MSDQDPYEPPQSGLEGESAPSAGSLGLGIGLALMVMLGGTVALSPVLLALPGAWPLLPLFFLLSAPAMAIFFGIRGQSRTAKGVWIGMALVLGGLLLLAGMVLWVCSGMRL